MASRVCSETGGGFQNCMLNAEDWRLSVVVVVVVVVVAGFR